MRAIYYMDMHRFANTMSYDIAATLYSRLITDRRKSHTIACRTSVKLCVPSVTDSLSIAQLDARVICGIHRQLRGGVYLCNDGSGDRSKGEHLDHIWACDQEADAILVRMAIEMNIAGRHV